eukprot:TRINITY_DN12316_c0_g1_i1.p3 TRINITY_DN12316_c0_g1~~TRINITY_DN12316_c0_g1_i1.p3  ORF type:complete len:108 (+),score=14.73 TRINITY_DN12316_c0_g1_i1:27-350(+)
MVTRKAKKRLARTKWQCQIRSLEELGHMIFTARILDLIHVLGDEMVKNRVVVAKIQQCALWISLLLGSDGQLFSLSTDLEKKEKKRKEKKSRLSAIKQSGSVLGVGR